MDTKTSITPQDIHSKGEQVFDIHFHPRENLIAAATITGLVEIYKYGDSIQPNHIVQQFTHHSSSCRGVSFSADGNYLTTISSDKSWKCVDGQGSIISLCNNAHESAINKMTEMSDTPSNFITGDDAGVVKIWDRRASEKEVMQYTLHEDFISDLLYIPDTYTLFSTSGDSTLGVYDIRKQSNFQRSDEQECELNCLLNIKHNRKLITGTQEGVILIFSWDKWGDCSDRYPGHPETVDCLYKIDETTILTGSSDGLIRVVSIQPNKILGVIGDHDEFPVEGMCINHTQSLLASYSHDHIIRFWDITMFKDDDDEEEEENEQVGEGINDDDGDVNEDNILDSDMKCNNHMSAEHKNSSSNSSRSGHIIDGEDDQKEEDEGEWEDMDDDDVDDEDDDMSEEDDDDESDQMKDDDSDSDDDSDNSPHINNKSNTNNTNRNNKTFKNDREKFYSDL